MTGTRMESDSIGAIAVPADAYWGAQTQRSIENFPFGPQEKMPIGIIHALAIVKQAAADVNRAHGLASEKAAAMAAAAAEVVAVEAHLLSWSNLNQNPSPQAAAVMSLRSLTFSADQGTGAQLPPTT